MEFRLRYLSETPGVVRRENHEPGHTTYRWAFRLRRLLCQDPFTTLHTSFGVRMEAASVIHCRRCNIAQNGTHLSSMIISPQIRVRL